ncbi:glycine oxidase ThiO [Virgibacillus salexigens]|uniref:glycine oxidase ThiO n=1 Tax=Virgibacillus massiliensis TaxID=1462526 RepID=UPI00136C0642|nr:glycine oxidase ThiO [Virgibacillus massiliensis]MYL40575.1 glycine oxidase ThiO [Virgibacillus massiliensis]
MKEHVDVVIIGGGVIGQSVAYYLSRSGVATTVIEQNRIGRKTTQAAAGMLGVHTENDQQGTYYQFCQASRNMYASLSDELFSLSGIDIQLSTNGMLEIATNEEQKQRLQAKQKAFEGLEWLDGGGIRQRTSALTHAVGGLYMQQDGNVEPLAVCEAFKQASLGMGSQVIENCRVANIDRVRDVFHIQFENGGISADHVVVAAGANSGKWFEATGLKNPMIPTKGECFAIKPSDPSIEQTLFFHNLYLVPKRDGRYIIGATSYHYDSSSYTSTGGIFELMNRLFRLFPSLQQEELHSCWTGVRPGTKDGRPIIGEHPDVSNLYFATGHYRNGILLAPATGKLVSDMVLNRYVPASIERLFTPARFRKGRVRYANTRERTANGGS